MNFWEEKSVQSRHKLGMAKQWTGYPIDVSDKEWSFACAFYLTLMHEAASQRVYPLREICNALRYIVRKGACMMPHDLPTYSGFDLHIKRSE